MTQAATLAQFASSGALTADTSGKVGLGTTAPNYKVTVNSSSTNSYQQLTNSVTGSASGDGFLVGIDSLEAIVWNLENSNIKFATNNTERMRIDSSGQLLLGITTNYFGERLTVYNSAATAAPVAFFYNPSGSSTGTILYTQSETAASTSWKILSGRATGGSERVVIYGNGNIQNANNSYGAISDIKLKENIVDATPKLDDLMQVKVRNYNLKTEPEHKQIGVVAQELEEIFPSMIEEAPDRDAEGNDLGTNTKAVKYSVFVPILIKAIQELKAELDAVKAKVGA